MKSSYKKVLTIVFFSYYSFLYSGPIISLLKSSNVDTFIPFVITSSSIANNNSWTLRFNLSNGFSDLSHSFSSSNLNIIETRPTLFLFSGIKMQNVGPYGKNVQFNTNYALYDLVAQTKIMSKKLSSSPADDSSGTNSPNGIQFMFQRATIPNISYSPDYSYQTRANGIAVCVIPVPNGSPNSYNSVAVPKGFSLPANTALATYINTNIGASPVVAGVPLQFEQVKDDLEIMLITQTTATNTGSTNTIICSLDGSASLISKGNLMNGVYVVLSKPLPLTQGASAPVMTYSIFSRSGTKLGTGTVSSFGTISYAGANAGQQICNGMILLNSAFKNNVYPIHLTLNPQVFLLQFSSVTATHPAASAASTNSNTQVSQQIAKLNADIQRRSASITTDSLSAAIKYQKTWYSEIYSDIYTPITQAFMPGTPAPSANSIKLCIDYNNLLIAQLTDLNQYLLAEQAAQASA
jgi:hypothetical protein